MKKIALSLALVAAIGCKGTAKDPKTLSKDDLNPPYQLASITDTEKMRLQWRISNTEEDVVGYNVYVAKTTRKALQDKLTDATVSKYDIASQAIRRCSATADLFAVFGFNKTDKFAQKDCDDFEIEAEEKSSSLALAEEAAELPSTFVPCTDGTNAIGDATLSVELSKAGISANPIERVDKLVSCTISKDATLSDGSKLVNGEKYVAFVVAVMGEKRNEISYTSNFVEDIPTAYTTVPVNVASGNRYKVTIDAESGVPTGGVTLSTSGTTCDSDSTSGGCRIYDSYTSWDDCSGYCFYVADDSSASERVFLVPQNNGTTKKNYFASRDPRPTTYTPGDNAIEWDNTQYFTGVAFTAIPGTILDIAIPNGSDYYYGKVFVESVTLGTGTKEVKLNVAIQKAKNEVFYLR